MMTDSRPLTKFYIVRHAESKGNTYEDKTRDPVLTSLGEQQAHELRKKLTDIHFDLVIDSPLVRTKQTADILTKERNLARLTAEAIREREYGDIYKVEDVRAAFDEIAHIYATLQEDEIWHYKSVHANMETEAEAVSRFITYLREAAVAHAGKTVLMVSHGNLMRSFLVHLGYGTFHELPHRSLKNTAYIVIESDGVDFFIKEVSGLKKLTSPEVGG